MPDLFIDSPNLELGSGREITAKPVLSPTAQISENLFTSTVEPR